MISRTQRQMDKLAAQNLAAKLQIESAFRRDLKTLFNKVNRDFVRHYKLYGQLAPIDRNKDAIRDLLLKYYRMINRKFGYQIRTNNVKMIEKIETKNVGLDSEIDKQLDVYSQNHSEEQANIISQTNIREQQEIVRKIRAEAALAGVLLTDNDVADQASDVLEEKYNGRIDTIAATETQNVSEHTKYIEATVIGGLLVGMNINNPLKKRWISVLDERTRDSHVAADGQEVPANDPFLVGSDKMMQPGDTSLGAGLDNVINCRCNAQYFNSEESI
jgi:hypothetical protein